MSFGAELRRRRIQSGLSQNELARRSGIDPAYVNKLELGKMARPSRITVLAIAQALDLNDLERDRFLLAAGLAPVEDWMTRAIQAEAALATLHSIVSGRSSVEEQVANVKTVILCPKTSMLDIPVKGSTTIPCSICEEDIWISMAGREALVDFNAVPICDECLQSETGVSVPRLLEEFFDSVPREEVR